MRTRIAANILTGLCGIWVLADWGLLGGWWRCLLGAVLVVSAVIQGVYLAREKHR